MMPLTLLKQGLTDSPGDERLLALLETIQQRVALHTRERLILFHRTNALKEQKEGRWMEAARSWLSVLREDPLNAQAREELDVIRRHWGERVDPNGKTNGSLVSQESADASEKFYTLGLISYADGDLDAAVVQFRACLAKKPRARICSKSSGTGGRRAETHPMTLRTRLLLYVVGLTVGSFVLYAGALSWTQREFLNNEQDRANIEESSRWTVLCEQSLLSKDEITLVHYVRELRRAEDVRWASFMSKEGKVIMHTDLTIKNTISADPVSVWALQSRRPQHREFNDESPPLIAYANPVWRGGEFVGVAILAFESDRQTGRISSTLLSSLKGFAGATFLCLGVGVIVALFVAKGLVGPLNELTSAVRRLGAGDWRARAAVYRKDEIGELAVAFTEMSRRLARLDELKDEFVATVSHDLRNPLGAITMAARYLIAPPNPLTPEMSRQVLNTVLVSTARLRNMVDNILDAAKIKQGPLVSLREPFSVKKVMGELHALFSAQAEEFGRDFRLEIPPDLPMAMGDEDQTYRLLWQPTNERFQIHVVGRSHYVRGGPHTRKTAGHPCVGQRPRNPSADLPTLFTRFYTAENVGTHVKKHQGTGLGLAIARALAETQGGTVTVESEPNCGEPLFCVHLPAWKVT
ncbi:MAG: HAMP domain-containing histidine kinase [Elusimicrobia bacterium]|nr:HAMP domain-containing histidine kinase [Elusimicrobiota bacterium]